MFESRFLQILNILYSWTVTLGSNLQSVFILYMRVVWGHQLFLAGVFKFANMAETVKFFSTLPLKHPDLMAHFVAGFEVLCGILLFLGFMSRMASIPVVAIMVSALSLAHSDAFVQLRFLLEPMRLVQQAPYPFLLTALIVLIFGPGRISVDAWLKRWANHQPKI